MVLTEMEINDIANKLQHAPNDVIFLMRENKTLPMKYRALINARAETIAVLVLHLVNANPANREIIINALKG